MTDDGSLKAAMLLATADATPDVHALIDRGVAQAGRIRRTRFTAWSCTSVTVIAVLGVAALVLGGSPAARPDPVTSVPASATPPDPASPAAVWADLRTLLPPGAMSVEGDEDVTLTAPVRGQGPAGPITVAMSARYDDGLGPAVIDLTVEGGPASLDRVQCSVITGSAPNDWTCKGVSRPDGSIAVVGHEVLYGPESTGSSLTPDVFENEVLLMRPDGTRVHVHERTMSSATGSVPVRSGPPLSDDQLVAIADADVWAPVGQDVADSLPGQHTREAAAR